MYDVQAETGMRIYYSLNSHQQRESILKRKFLNLADIDKEDPNQLMMCV